MASVASLLFDMPFDPPPTRQGLDGLTLNLRHGWTEEGYACLPGGHETGPVLVMLPSAAWQRIVMRHRPDLSAAIAEVAAEAGRHGRWRRLFGRLALLVDPVG